MSKKYTKTYAIKYIKEQGFDVVNINWNNGVKSMIEVECKNCGNKLIKTFYNFMRNHSCPNCRIDKRALTYTDIKKYVEIESNSNCKFLETEDSYKEKRRKQHALSLCKLKFQCKCGNEFEESFNSFKSFKKQKCNDCSGHTYKLSYEKVKQYIEKDSKSNCKLLSDTYENNTTPLRIKCSCGNEFTRTFADFKSQKAYKCYNCSGYQEHHTYEDIKDQIQLHDLLLLTSDKEYINTSYKLKLQCKNGHIFQRLWGGLKRAGFTCPYCNHKGYNRNTESFKKEVEELTNNEYIVLSKYKTMNEHVLIKHTICGNIWKITPHNFLDDNNRCPICNKSKGEQAIKINLDNYNINYDREYSFLDLYGDYAPLRFDFAIFEDKEKNKLKCLIEYDGEFHYMPIMGEKQFKRQKRYDELKNQYCIKNNIELIRIPYWDFDNIENILYEKINIIK